MFGASPNGGAMEEVPTPGSSAPSGSGGSLTLSVAPFGCLAVEELQAAWRILQQLTSLSPPLSSALPSGQVGKIQSVWLSAPANSKLRAQPRARPLSLPQAAFALRSALMRRSLMSVHHSLGDIFRLAADARQAADCILVVIRAPVCIRPAALLLQSLVCGDSASILEDVLVWVASCHPSFSELVDCRDELAVNMSVYGFDAFATAMHCVLVGEAFDESRVLAFQPTPPYYVKPLPCPYTHLFAPETRAHLARSLIARDFTKQAADFLQRPTEEATLQLLKPEYIFEALLSKRLEFVRWYAGRSPLLQVQLVLHMAAHEQQLQAARLAKTFKLDLGADAFTALRKELKANTMAGLLRLPARDTIMGQCVSDSECRAAVEDVVHERVTRGKTDAAVSEAFLAHFRAMCARELVLVEDRNVAVTGGEFLHLQEAGIGYVDMYADAMFRKKGTVSTVVPPPFPATAADAWTHLASLTSQVNEPEVEAASAEGGKSLHIRSSKKEKAYLIPLPLGKYTPTALPVSSIMPALTSTVVSPSTCSDTPSSPAPLPIRVHEPVLVKDERGFFRMPPSVPITMVQSTTDVESCVAAIYGSALTLDAVGATPHVLLGIDCEWQMPGLPTDVSPCATLQLAHGGQAWIFDMPGLHAEVEGDSERQSRLDAAFWNLFAPMAPCPSAIVLVYGGTTDFTVLARSHPYLRVLSSFIPAVVPGCDVLRILAGTSHTPSSTLRMMQYVDLQAWSLKVRLAAVSSADSGAAATTMPDEATGVGIAIGTVEEIPILRTPAASPSQNATGVSDDTHVRGVEVRDGTASPSIPLGGRDSVSDGREFVAVSGIEVEDVAQLAADTHSDIKVSGGLASLCGILLGAPLNKYWQMSYWLRRPLLHGQREYGALDAWVLPLLFRRLMCLPLRNDGPVRTPAKTGLGGSPIATPGKKEKRR